MARNKRLLGLKLGLARVKKIETLAWTAYDCIQRFDQPFMRRRLEAGDQAYRLVVQPSM